MITRRYQNDGNAKEVVKQIREKGLKWYWWMPVNRQKGNPDGVIPFKGVTYLVELKRPGEDLSDDQVKWHREWLEAGGGPIIVAHSFVDVMIGIGCGDPVPYNAR